MHDLNHWSVLGDWLGGADDAEGDALSHSSIPPLWDLVRRNTAAGVQHAVASAVAQSCGKSAAVAAGEWIRTWLPLGRLNAIVLHAAWALYHRGGTQSDQAPATADNADNAGAQVSRSNAQASGDIDMSTGRGVSSGVDVATSGTSGGEDGGEEDEGGDDYTAFVSAAGTALLRAHLVHAATATLTSDSDAHGLPYTDAAESFAALLSSLPAVPLDLYGALGACLDASHAVAVRCRVLAKACGTFAEIKEPLPSHLPEGFAVRVALHLLASKPDASPAALQMLMACCVSPAVTPDARALSLRALVRCLPTSPAFRDPISAFIRAGLTATIRRGLSASSGASPSPALPSRWSAHLPPVPLPAWSATDAGDTASSCLAAAADECGIDCAVQAQRWLRPPSVDSATGVAVADGGTADYLAALEEHFGAAACTLAAFNPSLFVPPLLQAYIITGMHAASSRARIAAAAAVDTDAGATAVAQPASLPSNLTELMECGFRRGVESCTPRAVAHMIAVLPPADVWHGFRDAAMFTPLAGAGAPGLHAAALPVIAAVASACIDVMVEHLGAAVLPLLPAQPPVPLPAAPSAAVSARMGQAVAVAPPTVTPPVVAPQRVAWRTLLGASAPLSEVVKEMAACRLAGGASVISHGEQAGDAELHVSGIPVSNAMRLPVASFIPPAQALSLLQSLLHHGDTGALSALVSRMARAPGVSGPLQADHIAAHVVLHSDSVWTRPGWVAARRVKALTELKDALFLALEPDEAAVRSAAQIVVRELLQRAKAASASTVLTVAAGTDDAPPGSVAAPPVQQPIPAAFFLYALTAVQRFSALRGSLTGFIERLVVELGASAFEDPAVIRARESDGRGSDATVRWDGFLAFIKSSLPASLEVLAKLPQSLLDALASSSREAALWERYRHHSTALGVVAAVTGEVGGGAT